MSEIPQQHRRAIVARPRRSIPHRLVALVSLTVLAVLLAACSNPAGAGLTVGSKTVDDATLKDELAAIAKNPQLKAQAVTKGKLDPTVAASWLTTIVQTQVADAALQKAGTKITKADTAAAQSWADGYFGAPAAFAAFPKAFRTAALARYVAVPAFVRTHAKAPTATDLRTAYDQSIASNCPSHRYVSHILVANEAAAKTAAAQIAAGADFGQVASTTSTDTQTAPRGGALGCIDTQNVDATFKAAAAATPIGQVSAPVQTQFGWHLIKVEDISTALPFDSVKAEIRQDLVERAPEGEKALVALMAKTKVKVPSRYGHWVVKNGQASVQPLASGTSSTSTTKPGSASTSTTKP